MRLILETVRPRFLLLSPVCVCLGFATAVADGFGLDGMVCALVLAGAISAHASVNTFNEYRDFRSGLDFLTARTPFSGGSGTLPAHPELASAVLSLARASFGITALIGSWLVWRGGAGLLPLGLAGLALIYFYSGPINRHPWLCLIAPGLGFGPLMVMGSHYVLTGGYSSTALAASLIPLFLVSDLLLLNQFPDLEADRKAGRRHLPIAWGLRRCSHVYVALLAAAYLSLILGVGLSVLPKTCLLGLATLPLAGVAAHGVLHNAENTPQLLPFMAVNVILSLLTPALVTVGMLL
jgi:1,4-dihydroxy-2-naphthoate octaprenyltransferase